MDLAKEDKLYEDVLDFDYESYIYDLSDAESEY